MTVDIREIGYNSSFMILGDHRFSSIVFAGRDIRPISDGEFGHD